MIQKKLQPGPELQIRPVALEINSDKEVFHSLTSRRSPLYNILEVILMSLIGYMEGTDPDLLSSLCAQGHDTAPLGNGTDGHGKYIAHVTSTDDFDVVIAYLHKLVSVSGMENVTIDDRLFACRRHDIPVILVVPSDLKQEAKDRMDESRDYVDFASPDELEDKIKKYI